MRRFEHGGDLGAFGADGGGLLDFSANLSPLGMPAEARQALADGIDRFGGYPDPYCRELTGALSGHLGVPRAHVLACAGATDAIARLCQAARPRRALVCAPCYSGYEQALSQVGAAVDYHRLSDSDDFAVTDALVEAVERAGSLDLLFLANPNNPTGLGISRPLLQAVIGACGRVGALVVLDECFIEFTGRESAVDLIGTAPNLAIVRAFTKTYALAGLRVGYLVASDAALVGRCADAGQTWAVSTPAQIAALAALGAEGYVNEARRVVAAARAELAAALARLGLRVIDGEANYLLFQSPVALYEPLLERGLLVRRCENYVGLDASWFRVAVRTGAENERLVAAVKEVLS